MDGPTTPDEAGEKSAAALAQARRNLDTSDTLAREGRYPEAYGFVVTATEELIRAFVYKMVELGLYTFDSTVKDTRKYVREKDLYTHERKYALFVGMDVTASMLELVFQAAKAGPDELVKLNARFEGGNSKADAERTHRETLPTFLPLIESMPEWEGARQAAHYSGADARGVSVTPGTKEDFDTLRPIVETRLNWIEEHFMKPFKGKDITAVRELLRLAREEFDGTDGPEAG